MTEDPPRRDELAEKAAECVLCLEDRDADPQAKLRWRAWLSESPAHRRAVESCRTAWIASAGLDVPWPTATEIAADAYRGDEPIPLPGVASGRLPERRTGIYRLLPGPLSGVRMPLATAALLLLAAVVVISLRAPRDTPEGTNVYATGRGEQKQLTLPDGSGVMLGPESRLEVRLRPAERTFHLRSGEAIFTATHNAARPFRVYAGTGWVEDIGTAFDVRSDPDRVTVTVLQGEVMVGTPQADDEPGGTQPAATRLSQNQQVVYGESLGAVHAVDAALATSWRGGQLAYVDQPLEQVVADLRRYSMKDIVMQDRSIGDLRYTGTISVNGIDQWAVGLARVYPVRIQILGDRLVLAAKPVEH